MALKGKAKAEYMREWMRKRRLDPVYRGEENERAKLSAREGRGTKRLQGECHVCGYNETTDFHHEGKDRVVYILCPNHHALITRGIKTLEDILTNKKGVRPETNPQTQEPIVDASSEVVTLAPRESSSVMLEIKSVNKPGPEPVSNSSETTVIKRRPPVYNPRVHKEGDLVRKWVNGAWLTLVVPEMDELGNVLEE